MALREHDILLLGAGTRLRFTHPPLTRALVEAHIGLGVMDIGAAAPPATFSRRTVGVGTRRC